MLLFGGAQLLLNLANNLLLRYLAASVPFDFSQEVLFFRIMSVYRLLPEALLFLGFYKLLSKSFPSKAGSMILSIIIGSLLAVILESIGIGVETSGASPSLVWAAPQLYNTPEPLLGIFFNFLLALFALSLGSIMGNWDEMLAKAGATPRPEGAPVITLTAGLYLTFGLVTLVLLPSLSALPTTLSSPASALLLSLLIPLLLLLGASQLLVSYSLLKGRRWGWIAAFLTSISAVAVGTNAVGYWIYATTSGFNTLITPILLLSFLASLLLGTALLGLLLHPSIRSYCRMINPYTEPQQITPTTP